VADKKSYGFGIIGCGMISHFHAQAIEAMPNAHLVCVMDRSAACAMSLGPKYDCTAYTDLDEFLAHPGLDIVTIATPSGAHLEPVEAAAKAGKHIICEKPLEVTLERIDRMIAACEQNKVLLAGVFPRRFNPSTIEFKKAIDSGRLGRITLADAYIKWYRTQEYYDSGAWRGTWALDGGGALMNQSIHTIDLLYHLAGDLDTVSAFGDLAIHRDIEVEDNAAAVVRFKSGALGVIEGSTSCFSNTGHPAEVHVCGEAGSIFMKDDAFTVWDFKEAGPDDERIKQEFKSQEGVGAGAADPKAISFIGHQWNFEDFISALEAGRRPAVDGHEARKSVEIILAIYESALAGGKPVKLPLNKTPDLKQFK
jgi:UDP-N-acetyl-2-amino-2-deoxyglucuronate dehydrogenase